MALIDEYKQAIQDVLDGRAKDAPKPSELPDTDDKLATFWAAAAALNLVPAPSGGGVLVVHATSSGQNIAVPRLTLDKTFKQIEDGMTSGGVVVVSAIEGLTSISAVIGTHKESGVYEVYCRSDITYSADSEDGYPYMELG